MSARGWVALGGVCIGVAGLVCPFLGRRFVGHRFVVVMAYTLRATRGGNSRLRAFYFISQ